MAMYINFKLKNKICLIMLVVIITVTSSINYFTNEPSVAANADNNSIKLPIIMYHGLLKDKNLQGEYVISPDKFENDLKTLTERGYTTVVIEDLINYVYNDKALPEKPIVLAFDDGNYNNYIYAFPLLKKYNSKIVLSPIAYYTEEYSKSLDLNAAYSSCTWDNLQEMADSGHVELQNHSYNLHDNQNGRMGVRKKASESDSEYKTFLVNDLSTAQNLFRNNLKYTPKAFSYPYGYYDETTEEIIKSLGFKSSIVCQERMNYITKEKDCLYKLCKILRSNSTNSTEFFDYIETL